MTPANRSVGMFDLTDRVALSAAALTYLLSRFEPALEALPRR